MNDPLPQPERVVSHAQVGELAIEARTGIDGSYLTITELGLGDYVLVPLSDARALAQVILDQAADLAGYAPSDDQGGDE